MKMPYAARSLITGNPGTPVRLLWIVLIALSGMAGAGPSRADDMANRAALASCLGQHLKAEDNATVMGVLMLLMSDAEPADSSLHGLLAPKRDEIMGNTAKLLTRLGEENCRAELMAVSTTRPGERFSLLFQ